MEIINALKKQDGFVCARGASEKEIDNAEKTLGLEFSKEYKAYLREFGAVIVDGSEFTGIIKSKRLNVVDVTINEKKMNSLIPKNFYVIENLGIDGIIILQNAEGEVFSIKPSCDPVRIASSFKEYITGYKQS